MWYISKIAQYEESTNTFRYESCIKWFSSIKFSGYIVFENYDENKKLLLYTYDCVCKETKGGIERSLSSLQGILRFLKQKKVYNIFGIDCEKDLIFKTTKVGHILYDTIDYLMTLPIVARLEGIKKEDSFLDYYKHILFEYSLKYANHNYICLDDIFLQGKCIIDKEGCLCVNDIDTNSRVIYTILDEEKFHKLQIYCTKLRVMDKEV
jgi:hypothetical protein